MSQPSTIQNLQIVLFMPWATYAQATPFLLVVAILLTCLLLWEAFAPVYLRSTWKGKIWRLPPGPAGYPVIGNLLEWRRARSSVPILAQYVRITFLSPTTF